MGMTGAGEWFVSATGTGIGIGIGIGTGIGAETGVELHADAVHRAADAVHRLGVTLLLVVALFLVVGTVLAERRVRRARRRVRALLGGRNRPRRSRKPLHTRELTGWIPVLGAACAGLVLLDGVLGAGLGGLAGYAVRQWLRRRERSSGGAGPDGTGGAAERAEAERQLPLAADLMAACVTAGADPVVAAEAVGECLGGPVGDRLALAAVELRLGGESAQVWGRLGALPGARPLARCLARACDAGAPAAEELALIAADCRAAWTRAAAARAHRAGVLIAAPVGLCLLPAFLAVGVGPVVIGLAGGVLHID
ncbi:type II secretion system F family protein [Streptomyces sp. B-S-A8]|uniref:Type II secretion system F family protein n=1 Tax=Streptomyces solicavernae TaxID=3043614 RepID=A0ABT6RZ70_9ACTN|nr:type II secretion system F family protein [Streptomyces sp. B-S-A8]MDI3389625.1 type II secretion system F family protein [Streptomyces sp. B-S-A8]